MIGGIAVELDCIISHPWAFPTAPAFPLLLTLFLCFLSLHCSRAHNVVSRGKQVQRRAVLIGRMGKAAEAKKEQVSAARHDLEKFYEERREKIARNQAVNVREQKDFQEEMATVMATGTEWEKVAKVADIAPKGGKSGSRDVDRMRMVMIEVCPPFSVKTAHACYFV